MAINRDKILQEAQKLVDKKRYDKAIAEYQKVVAEDPNDVRTLLKIGDIYLRMQQFADAIATYDRVASYYSVQGFSVKAVAVYKQIREIIQKHAPSLEDRFGHVVPKLAELLTQLDLRSDALAYYDEMATRLQVMGRERDAIDVFKKVVALDSNNPVSHLRLADAYTRVRDFDASTQEFTVASEILLRIGRKDDALRVVERILQHRQEPKFAKLAAEILLQRAQPNDAMGALSKLQIAFKANPKDLETLGLLARAFDGLGQPSKAVEVQKEAARIARETGPRETFVELVQVLVQRAPDDEGVRQLVGILNSDSKASIAPASMGVPASAYPSFGGPIPGVAAERAPSAPPQAPPQPLAPVPAPPPTPARPQPIRPIQPVVAPPQARQPMPSAPLVEAEEPSQAVIEEISVADLVVEDFEQAIEPVSDDEPPFALRSSYPPGDLDPANRSREVLGGVEQARRVGDYESAVELLRRAIAHHPHAREFRERLCDVLIECGDQDGAVLEMLAFAQHLVEASDADAAARLLDEVLLLEPNNRPALELLRALGYAVATPEDELETATNIAPQYRPSEDEDAELHDIGQHLSNQRPSSQGYDPSAPLPGYDLDELTSDEVPIAPNLIPLVPGAEAREVRAIQLDDPFASEATSFGMPAYPLDEEVRQRPSAPGVLDESALEEIEFFTTHGMLEEAEGILSEQLARLPNNPLLLEKRREIEAMRASGEHVVVAAPAVQGFSAPPAAAASGFPALQGAAQGFSAPQGAAQEHAEVARSSGAEAADPGAGPRSVVAREHTVDRAYDIAHALDEMDNALESFMPREQPLGAGQVSVEQVFEQFKQGVAAQIAESDAATHYDLGVAYKEMGLIADAIHEFELASRDPTRECVCQSMIGMLHLQVGNLDVAIDAFIRGLHASQKNPDQELALTYEIGNAYEMRQTAEQAIYYFQLVARLDPSYRDPRGSVAERIAALERTTGQDKAPKSLAVGAGDEFDQAFDDLFNPKG